MLRNKLNEFWNDYDLLLSKKKEKTSINTFQPVCVKVEYPEIVCRRLRPILSYGGERETKNEKKKKKEEEEPRRQTYVSPGVRPCWKPLCER